MILRNPLISINQFLEKIRNQIRNIYLNSNFYEKKISKIYNKELIYKPSPHLLSSLIKYQTQKINIKGPFSADTFFSKKNLSQYDVAIGMYHDQVLTPMKSIFNFDAINLTLGLPFLRVSPDHGTNNEMIGKNISNAQSIISSINFFKKIR